MYADDFLKLNTSREKSFKQATIIESKPIGTEPDVKKKWCKTRWIRHIRWSTDFDSLYFDVGWINFGF